MGKPKRRRRATAGSAEWLREISEAAVTPEELIRVEDEVQRLPKHLRDFEGRSFTIARLFAGDPIKVVAISFRMQALARIVPAGVKGFTFPTGDPDDSVMAASSVFAAAAAEPALFPEGNLPCFDRESFLQRVLDLSPESGSA